MKILNFDLLKKSPLKIGLEKNVRGGACVIISSPSVVAQVKRHQVKWTNEVMGIIIFNSTIVNAKKY